MLQLDDFNILTRAAPSISIASATGGIVNGFVVRFSRHFNKSDFTRSRRWPNLEMDGVSLQMHITHIQYSTQFISKRDAKDSKDMVTETKITIGNEHKLTINN